MHSHARTYVRTHEHRLLHTHAHTHGISPIYLYYKRGKVCVCVCAAFSHFHSINHSETSRGRCSLVYALNCAAFFSHFRLHAVYSSFYISTQCILPGTRAHTKSAHTSRCTSPQRVARRRNVTLEIYGGGAIALPRLYPPPAMGSSWDCSTQTEKIAGTVASIA